MQISSIQFDFPHYTFNKAETWPLRKYHMHQSKSSNDSQFIFCRLVVSLQVYKFTSLQVYKLTSKTQESVKCMNIIKNNNELLLIMYLYLLSTTFSSHIHGFGSKSTFFLPLSSFVSLTSNVVCFHSRSKMFLHV